MLGKCIGIVGIKLGMGGLFARWKIALDYSLNLIFKISFVESDFKRHTIYQINS